MPRYSRVLAGGRWVVVLAAACGAVAGCQSKAGGQKVPPADPNYLQLLSLAATADKTHVAAIAGPDGRTWYAERTPGLVLSDCAYEQAFCTKGPDVRWSVVVPLGGAASRLQLNEWLEERKNQEIGVVLGGKLRLVAPTSGALYERLWISAFKSEAEAEAEAKVLRAGGRRGA